MNKTARRAVGVGVVLAAVCGAGAGNARAQDTGEGGIDAPTTRKVTYPKPALVPSGRPRVFLNPASLAALRERVKAPQNALAWAEHLKNLEAGVDGNLPEPKTGGGVGGDRRGAGGNADSAVLARISSRALACVLDGDAARGREAVAAMRRYVETVRFAGRTDYNNAGQAIYTIALVYDWCHPLLSVEDKAALYDAAIRLAGRLEVGWPPVGQGNVTGHGPEGQIFRDLLAVAAAMYDEHPEMWDWVAGRFFDRMVAPRTFAYQAHMHPQGMHYCNYRGQWEVLATWLMDRLGAPKVFGEEQRYLMYWSLYARRGDGSLLRDGDTHINNRPLGEYWTSPYRTMFLAANYFADPYLKFEANRIRPGFAPMAPRQNQACDAVETLLFNDPSLEPKPLSELPLSRYFPGPKGAMIARTGWDDAFGPGKGSVVAEMKVNEWYFSNHQHLDAGAFQIFYRGSLANDSGYYQAGDTRSDNLENDGASGYGSLYDINYYKRSVAHNVMLVFDPAEKFDTRRWEKMPIANDGGQRMPNRWNEPREHGEFLDPANGYRIGEVLGRGFGPDPKTPDYTYLKGDLAKAYSAKVRGYERSFVFLNFKDAAVPAAMVVLDRVESSDPMFRKAWLLHGLEEPEVTGATAVWRDRRKGYTGKLTVSTLLPDGATTTLIGGPGKEAWVNGINYECKLRPDGANEGHGWRMEVSPGSPANEDLFLHVLQVGEHAPRETTSLKVSRLDAGTHVGAVIGDRVVLLGRKRDRVSGPVELNMPSAGKLLVADLTAGKWVVRNGGTVQEVEATAEAGVAWAEVGAGRVTVERR